MTPMSHEIILTPHDLSQAGHTNPFLEAISQQVHQNAGTYSSPVRRPQETTGRAALMSPRRPRQSSTVESKSDVTPSRPTQSTLPYTSRRGYRGRGYSTIDTRYLISGSDRVRLSSEILRNFYVLGSPFLPVDLDEEGISAADEVTIRAAFNEKFNSISEQYEGSVFDACDSAYSQDGFHMFFSMITSALTQLNKLDDIKCKTGGFLFPNTPSSDSGLKIHQADWVIVDGQICLSITINLNNYRIMDEYSDDEKYHRKIDANYTVCLKVIKNPFILEEGVTNSFVPQTAYVMQLHHIKIYSEAVYRADADFLKKLILGHLEYSEIKPFLDQGVLARCDSSGNPLKEGETFLTEPRRVTNPLLQTAVAATSSQPVHTETRDYNRKKVRIFCLLLVAEILGIGSMQYFTDAYKLLWDGIVDNNFEALSKAKLVGSIALLAAVCATALFGCVGCYRGFFVNRQISQLQGPTRRARVARVLQGVPVAPGKRSGLASAAPLLGKAPKGNYGTGGVARELDF